MAVTDAGEAVGGAPMGEPAGPTACVCARKPASLPATSPSVTAPPSIAGPTAKSAGRMPKAVNRSARIPDRIRWTTLPGRESPHAVLAHRCARIKRHCPGGSASNPLPFPVPGRAQNTPPIPKNDPVQDERFRSSGRRTAWRMTLKKRRNRLRPQGEVTARRQWDGRCTSEGVASMA